MPLLRDDRIALLQFIDIRVQAEINSRSLNNQGPQFLQNAEQRKERNDGPHYILRKLLEMNINNPLYDQISSLEHTQQEAYPLLYIESVLVRAFPDLFQWNADGYLDTNDNVINKDLIRAGLGFDLNLEKNQQELNLTQFRYPILNDLYSKDGNILWVILQSLKPITEEFTREDKIDCYIELAHAFYRDGTPHLYKQAQTLLGQRSEPNAARLCIMTPGLDSAYKGAYDMACCAYAIAVDRSDLINKVNQAFFPPNCEQGFWEKISNLNLNRRFTTWLSGYQTRPEWEKTCREIEETVHTQQNSAISQATEAGKTGPG